MGTLLRHDIRNLAPVRAPRRVYQILRNPLRIGSLMLMDVVALVMAVVVSHLVRSTLLVEWFGPPSLSLLQRLQLFPVYLVIQLLLFAQLGLYEPGDRWRSLRAQIVGVTLGAALLIVGSRLYPPVAHPSYMVLLWGFGALAVMGGRGVAIAMIDQLHRRGLGLNRTVVIGQPEVGEPAFRSLRRGAFTLVGFISPKPYLPSHRAERYLGSMPHLAEVIRAHGVQEVIVAEEIDPRDLVAVWDTCVSEGAHLRIMVPSLSELTNPMQLYVLNGRPLLEVVQPRLRITQFALKRLFDVVATSLGLLALSPLLLLIALLVRLDSPGPVFFKQKRITVKGRTFWMYKFRSMHVDAEAQLDNIIHMNERKDTLMFKVKNDPRITRIGALLRRTSLDELPQLLNVLRGEMSLVGPRPPLPREVEQYAPHHRQRLEVLPGITGLWQVSGRSEIEDFEDVVRLDLSYIRNWSLWLDFKILFKTIPAVIRSRGAC